MAPIRTVDTRIIAMMRLLLAASALLVILIVPTEPSRLVAATYTVLVLYTLYSVVLYVLALRDSAFLTFIITWAHWVDVGWYVLLIALTSGTSSIFFFGFFFSILVASFRWGFASGLRVTGASALLFSTIGFVTATVADRFELDRFLLRPIYMLVLGYMIAYWGGFEIALKRRLTLLQEITGFSNPRFGVEHTIGTLIERLRAFYNADVCLLVLADSSTGEHRLFRADRDASDRRIEARCITADVARLFLAVPADLAVVYPGNRRGWHRWRGASTYYAYNVQTRAPTADAYAASAALAATLDGESFVSVPWRDRSEASGRLYLVAERPNAFTASDADFLLHVMEHVMPVIDNIRLVDHLATDAAEEERKKIARDLHDSIIQPYIGLHLGITAVRQKLASGSTDVTDDIERLLTLTNDGIADLRGYVHGLRDANEQRGGLIPAVRRFASKFGEATRIDVQVKADETIRVNDRLAAEVFQMVAEGLSNIRRHTTATRATIAFACRNERLVLWIENEGDGTPARSDFTPRSLTERAKALGGRIHVQRCDDTSTMITIEIPL
jgi:signal transduction histidine kinase